MANFIAFNEGKTELANNGLPSTCRFLLSTKSVDGTSAFSASDTLAGGVGEITGTGYARTSEAEPTAASGVVSFAEKSWDNGAATDWPSNVRSVVLVTSADNSGKAICAWNLIAGATARDMSQAHTTEKYTPQLTLS